MQSSTPLSVLQLLILGILTAVSLLMMCRRRRKIRRRKAKENVKTAKEAGTPVVPPALQKPKSLDVKPTPAPANEKQPSRGTAVPIKESKPGQQTPNKGTVVPLVKPQQSDDSEEKIQSKKSSGTARPSLNRTARDNNWDKDISPFSNTDSDRDAGIVEPFQGEQEGEEEEQQQQQEPEEQPEEPEEQPEEPEPVPVVIKEPETQTAKPSEPKRAKEPETQTAKPSEPKSVKEPETHTATQAEPKKTKAVPFELGPLLADQNRLYFPPGGGVQQLKIKNTSSSPIAILVDVSDSDKYAIKPNCTFVEPGDTLELTIKRSEGGNISDTIDILFMGAPIDAEDPGELFRKNPIKNKDRSNCMPIVTSVEL